MYTFSSENSLYIIIPAYNEEANVKQLIDDWYPVVENYNDGNSKLIVIDDGSTDNTYQVLQESAKFRPLLVPLTKPNQGHGATIMFGYNYALEQGADYIFQTDSDGQTIPSEFEQFWKIRDSFDMVIGYRNKREDGFSRIFVTKTLRIIIRICFGVYIMDANTPFRLMKALGLKENMQYIPKGYNLSNVILSVIYAKRNQKVKYIPITFRPRQGGINSINLKKIIKIGLRAFKDFRIINTILKNQLSRHIP